MNLTFLTESGGLVDTYPDDAGAQIVWGLILVAIVGMYFLSKRFRNRARDHYWEAKQREEDLRANDPDMRKDDG